MKLNYEQKAAQRGSQEHVTGLDARAIPTRA